MFHAPADTADIANAGVETNNSETVASGNDNLHIENDRECVICAEIMLIDEFPQASVTTTCNHSAEACLGCIQRSIKTDLDTKIWTEIRCPECAAAFDYLGIQEYADDETWSR